MDADIISSLYRRVDLSEPVQRNTAAADLNKNMNINILVLHFRTVSPCSALISNAREWTARRVTKLRMEFHITHIHMYTYVFIATETQILLIAVSRYINQRCTAYAPGCK